MEAQIATIENVEGISQLLQTLFQQEADFTPDIDKQRRAVTELIESPEKGHFLIIKETNKVIACVSLLYLISTAAGGKAALSEDMVVNTAYRGSGLGKQLLDRAIAFAEQQGCKRLTLLTDQDNVGAQRFYQQAGFKASTMLPMRRSL